MHHHQHIKAVTKRLNHSATTLAVRSLISFGGHDCCGKALPKACIARKILRVDPTSPTASSARAPLVSRAVPPL